MYSDEEFDKTKTKILKYIIYQKRSENEIRTKFKDTVEENMLEDIIEYLKEAKYINDYEFVEKTVTDMMYLKTLSQKEVRYKLMAKGIDRNTLDDYFSRNQEELVQYEIKSAKKIFIKKEKAMDKHEIKEYLIKKGYKYDNIEIAEEE